MKAFELILVILIGISFYIRNYFNNKFKEFKKGKIQTPNAPFCGKNFSKFSFNFLYYFIIILITEKTINKEMKFQKIMVNISTIMIYLIILTFIIIVMSGQLKIVLPRLNFKNL